MLRVWVCLWRAVQPFYTFGEGWFFCKVITCFTKCFFSSCLLDIPFVLALVLCFFSSLRIGFDTPMTQLTHRLFTDNGKTPGVWEIGHQQFATGSLPPPDKKASPYFFRFTTMHSLPGGFNNNLESITLHPQTSVTRFIFRPHIISSSTKLSERSD